ncbi:MAG: hypothetical protein JWO19_4185 [Bryobacterales bacterium]|nr:hypothetical protein [Bryobacterales bacterium]
MTLLHNIEVLVAQLHITVADVQEENNKPVKEKLMNVQHRIFACVGVALLCATASFAQHVKTDYDRGTDFSQYKTYSWEKVQTPDPLWVDRIKEAVNAALVSKGLTPVASGGDISIVAIEMTKNNQSLNTFYNGFGGGWRWGGGFGDATTTVDNYKVGTLVVDLFDSKTKSVIWRGSSSDTLSDKSDKNIKNLDKGVQKMFDHFPPDQKKK